MGLEVAQYINGLNVAWPLAGDTKSQGDDHLRLLKGVLQATFPNASKPFYIPSAEAFAGAVVLDATDQNNLIMVDTTAGDIACTLPGTLGVNDKGWECEIVRTNQAGGINGIVVSPTTGSILSAVGATATIRIERVFEPVRFKWTGTAWFCVKTGIPIGGSMNYDSATVPPGFRAADGTAYSTTALAELNALWGTATLKDKRGRVEAGIDSGTGRLTSSYFGTGAVVGAIGGLEYNTLTVATMPVHAHSYGDSGHSHGVSHNANAQSASSTGGGAFTIANYAAATINILSSGVGISIQNNGSGAAHANVQPTIITNKLIRVC